MALTNREHSTYVKFKSGEVHWGRGSESGVADAIEGVITGIKYEDHEFEWQTRQIKKHNIIISIQDGSEKYTLTESADSRAGLQLQNKLLNTQVGDRISISPTKENGVDKDGKPIVMTSGVFVNIGRNSVPQKYNKANPGDLPPWKKFVVNGKDIWDKTDQLNFLEQELLAHFQHAAAVEVASSTGEFHESEIPQWEESPEPSGDVPF